MRTLVLAACLLFTACASPGLLVTGEVHSATDRTKPGIYVRGEEPAGATKLPPIDNPVVMVSPKTKFAFKDFGSMAGANVLPGGTFRVKLELHSTRKTPDRLDAVLVRVDASGHVKLERVFEVPSDELRFERELVVVLAPEATLPAGPKEAPAPEPTTPR